jgi:predicted O-methyltransferase YrrM
VSLSTRLKNGVNRLLAPANVHLETLTLEKMESARLAELEAAGHFEKPVFPILQQFKDCDPSAILAEVARHEARFAEFAKAPRGGSQYSLDNDYFSSPDAEVLYAIVRIYRPARIIEVGSGNSTKLFRHTISDGGLRTKLTSIDPSPRCEIELISGEIIRQRVETLRDTSQFSSLQANDILFIDSSHEIKPGNDVLWLLLNVVPALSPGVLIHLHDIFLPFEYPRSWVIEERRNWTEQYLLQAMLSENRCLEVLWPAYYLQRSQPLFDGSFVHRRGATAASLWLLKR